MDLFSPFIPMDRRMALARGDTLPDHTRGAALLADLSGYTALMGAFVAALGPRQGVEALFRALAPVFAAQVAAIHAYQGSILGFSGDALTCWFDGDDGPRTTAAARALQALIRATPPVTMPSGPAHALALKCVVAAGVARRFLVGDPAWGLLDVLAGPPLSRAGAGDLLARPGEVLLDEAAAAAVEATGTWRQDEDGEARFLIVALPPPGLPLPQPWPPLPPHALTTDQVRPWLHPAVWERLHQDETFQVELRPAIALFARFTGIDFERPSAAGRLDLYIRWVQGVLAQHGGCLLSLTIGDKGDYLYASFGAPLAHEDDPVRAAAAALALRTPPPACGYIRGIQIGLAGGPVYAGPYGGPASRTYGARGEVVNLAARLMQAAGPGSILATREVRRTTRGRFEWATMPPLAVKGRTDPVLIAGLLGERGLGLSEPAHGTPLVGRAAELAVLDAKIAAARAGHGQIVAVTGEAGLGKSRLLAETVPRARAAGFLAYGGAAQSYGTQTAYLAWQPIWRTFFDLDPDGLPDEQAAQLADAVASLDPQLLPRLPLLGAVLGLNLPDTEITACMDARLRKESLVALLIAALRARTLGGGACAATPVVLVLEDAHWLDPLSHELLEAVARAIPALPVLLLLAARPPEVAGPAAPRLAGLAHFTALHLTHLTPDEAAALVTARLGLDGEGRDPRAAPAIPPELAANVAELTRRAEGNPFYLEELLAYLADQGIDPRAPGTLAGVEWPASLQSLLLARIDQLTEEQRTVLKVASVVGRLFRRDQLWGVYPNLGPEPRVSAALAELDRLGLTPLDLPEPDWVHMFKHVVAQEVTYGSLPHALRRQLHEQFAAWLEAGSAAAGGAPPLDLLAYHYGQSGHQAKAREYYQKAGDAAAAAYNNVAAAAYYEPLLAWIAPAEQAGVLVALGDVLERSGAWDAAATRYEAALATAGTAAFTRARALLGLGLVRRNQGAFAEAVPWLDAARTAYRDAGQAAGEGRVLAELGRVYELRGEYAEARTLLEAGLAVAAQAGDRVLRALALNNLGNVVSQQGDYLTARALYEESLALRREGGDRRGVAISLNNLGLLADEQGAYAAARALYEESLALRRELGDRWGIAMSLSNLGTVAYNQGDYAPACTLYEESLALRRLLSDRWGIAWCLNNLGLVAYHRGDFSTARRLHEESLALRRELSDRPGSAAALHNLGLVALADGRPTEAQARLGDALRLCRDLGVGKATTDTLVGAAGVLAPAPQAARLLGTVAALLATQGTALGPAERRVYDQTAVVTQQAQGAPAYAAAFAAGQALPGEAAVAEALAALP